MPLARLLLVSSFWVVHASAFAAPRARVVPPRDPAVEARVDALLSRMNLAEKIGQLTQFGMGPLTGPEAGNASAERQRELIRAGSIGSIIAGGPAAAVDELQRLAMEKSRMRIPLLFALDVIHGFHTTFPNPMAEAASFDPVIAERTAAAAAGEAAASGVRWTFAPMVDVGRDARWGRVVEGSGEDPYLHAVMAAARVRGFQGARLSSDPTRVLATAKHYVAYGAPEAGRDYAGAEVSEVALRSVFLPPFRAAVDAGVGSIMSGFHDISGVPASAHRWLLTDVLRGEWGFDGIVVSDWGSVKELVVHGFAADAREAAAKALLAGVDVDMCSGTYLAELPGLVRDGVVPMRAIDEAARRVLRTKVRMGLFEQPYSVVPAAAEEETRRAAARELALEAARRSIVLLKNDGALLPLDRKRLRRIAVVGPFADAQLEHLGSWWAKGKPQQITPLVDAIRAQAGPAVQVVHALGTDFRGKKKDLGPAIAAARSADVVLVAAGDPGWNTGENNSRVSLDMSPPQQELLRALAATGKPIVLVLMNGGAMTLAWESEHLPAILETWALGAGGTRAIAEALFGDINPSGKLPVTFPRSVGQVPIHYGHKHSGRPPTIPGGSRYTDSPSDPLFPFGFGLSYTKFTYDRLTVSSPEITPDGKLEVTATVRNVGQRTGTDVAQMYLRDVAASVTRPVKELRGFEKVTLAPGESRQVRFAVGPADLGLWTTGGRFVVEPGEFRVWIGPNSAEGPEGHFRVTGAKPPRSARSVPAAPHASR